MRILYFDQYFSTRAGISGTRSYEFGRLLARDGHRVSVVTSATSYAGGTQRRFLEKRDVEGIAVYSLRIGYSSRMSYPRRALAFLAFMVCGTAIGLVLPRADVVFATSTPLTIGIPGYLVSLLRGGRFVFEVRDLWPEAPIQLGIIRNPVLVGVLCAIERFLYRKANRIVALSPGMADGIERHGIDAEKIRVVPNASDLDLFEGKTAAAGALPESARGRFVALYAGAMGPANGLDYLVDLAEASAKRGDAVTYVCVGDGPERERLVARARGLDLANLVFLDAVPRERVAELILAADATLTLFADLPILATNSPNKLFDYLAAGKPALVNSDGWTRTMVEESGAGFYLPPGDPAAGARAVAELAGDKERAANMGEAARRLAETTYSRDVLLRQLVSAFETTVAESPVLGGLGSAVKRLLDVALSAAAIVVFAPLMAGIAVAIRRDSQGPVFYVHERPGRDGRLFNVYKFRTMVEGADRAGLGHNVEDGDDRITRVGAFLREWSLDELPQLFNVLFGRMSLVGPRPPLAFQVDRYDDRQRRRLLVKPGITGWAQVNGRNALSWAQKIEHDVWYVDHQSLCLDLRILARTLKVVLSREGLYEEEAGVDDDFNRPA